MTFNTRKVKGNNPVSDTFHERLITLNKLSEAGFVEWIFHPGMLFGSGNKWWGGGGSRSLPHEGLDFLAYKTKKSGIGNINEMTRVPALFDGRVVHIIDDFLGKSIFIRHDIYHIDRKRLYTVYGHLVPSENVKTGSDIREDISIGTLAAEREIPSHLHISIAWVSDRIHPENLNWKTILDSENVVLIDPLKVISCPYTVTD